MVCPRPPATLGGARDLRAALAFIEASVEARREDRVLERCPDLAAALRALVDRLLEVGEFEGAGSACGLLSRGTTLMGEDLLSCARSSLRVGRLEEARRFLAAFVAEAGLETTARLEASSQAAQVLEEAARFIEAADFLDVGTGPEVPSSIVLRRIHNLLRGGVGDAAREAFFRFTSRPDAAPSKEFLREACLTFTRYGETSSARHCAGLLVTLPEFAEPEADVVILVAAAAGDEDLARRAAKRLASDPENSKAGPDAVRRAAAVLDRHGFLKEASRILEEGLHAGLAFTTDDLIMLARLLVRVGRVQDAHRVMSLIPEVQGGSAGKEWERLSSVWLDVGLADEAIFFLRKNEAPFDADWVLALGRSLHVAGRDDEEEALYKEMAGKIVSEDAGKAGGEGASGLHDFWRRVGSSYRGRPDLARARKAFEEALRTAISDTQRAQAHLDIAETLLDGRKGDLKRAESEVLSVIQIDIRDPAIESRLARLIERIGMVSSLSIALLEAAVRRSPHRPDLWQRLGTERLKSLRHREALEAFRSSVETSETAQDRRDALVEALTAFLDADRSREAIYLFTAFERGLSKASVEPRVTLPPEVARRLGDACASVGDRPCVARTFERYLEAPILEKGAYLECAKTLARFGLWNLAGSAISNAFKALPRDRAWEVEAVAGEVALARGRLEDSEAHFSKALESAPQRLAMMERIARAYEESGRLGLAATWWRRVLNEAAGTTRLRALGSLMQVMARSGHLDGARSAWLDTIQEAQSGTAAFIFMELLDDLGLKSEAMAIARRVTPALVHEAGLDPTAVWPWIARLFARSGHFEEATEVVRLICLDTMAMSASRAHAPSGSRRDDLLCVQMSRALSDRSRPKDSLGVLESRCRERECGSPVLIEIAALRMALGDREGAQAAAKLAAQHCETPEEVLGPLGPLFREARAFKEYLRVLDTLRGRQGFDGDRQVMLETARALISTGDYDAAMLVLAAYLGTGRGRLAEVYRLLSAEGCSEDAARVMAEAPLQALEGLHFEDLRDVVVGLWRSGHQAEADRVLQVSRRDAIPSSEEAVGRILADLGRWREAIEAFERVGVARVSYDGLDVWVRSLWATGARTKALEVALAAWRGEARDQPTESRHAKDTAARACGQLIGFFLEEEVVGPAWKMYEVCGSRGGLSGDLEARLALQTVRSGDERFLQQARKMFLDVLLQSKVVEGPLAEFIRVETVRGRAEVLIRDLKEWGSSWALLEARALTACLSRRQQDLDDALLALRDTGGSGNRPDPRGLSAAARALFECGRFQEAYRLALEGVEQSGPDGPLGPLSRLAVRSGLAAGAMGAPRKIEALVQSKIEDRYRKARLVAGVRKDAGDWRGHAEATFEAALLSKTESGRHVAKPIAACRAALLAGDKDLATRSAALVLESSKNRAEAARVLAQLSRRHIRSHVPLLEAEQRVWPGDAALARALLESSLLDGPDSALQDAAERYVRALADARAGWADVVALAARHLRLGLMAEGLRHLETGEGRGSTEDRVDEALKSAGIAYLRAGDEISGRRLVIRAAARTRSPREFLTRLAEDALSDPFVPFSLVKEALQTATARHVSAGGVAEGQTGFFGQGLDNLPLIQASRCIADLFEGNEECLRTQSLVPGVCMASLRKALLMRRWSQAAALIRATQAEDASRVSALRTAALVATTAWPVEGKDRDDVRAIALLVREGLKRTGTATIPAYPSLEAHLSDLEAGPGAGLVAHEARLVVAPADAETRNNLAYYLSVGGLDLRRALREVRLAEALASRGHPFYLETEAWIEFLRGETRRALEIQERARGLWHLEQGGGLAESFLHLGHMYEAVGYMTEAEAAYRIAAVLEPLEAAGVEALARWRNVVKRGGRALR